MIKPLLAGLALTLFLLGFTTQVFSNLFQMLEGSGSFFVPAESDIWSFKVTKSNPGSGSWWLSGEDHRHYYALSEQKPEYIYIRRDNNCPSFDPQRLETWCETRTRLIPNTQADR